MYLDFNVSSGPLLSEIEIADGPGPKLDNNFICTSHTNISESPSSALSVTPDRAPALCWGCNVVMLVHSLY